LDLIIPAEKLLYFQNSQEAGKKERNFASKIS